MKRIVLFIVLSFAALYTKAQVLKVEPQDRFTPQQAKTGTTQGANKQVTQSPSVNGADGATNPITQGTTKTAQPLNAENRFVPEKARPR